VIIDSIEDADNIASLWIVLPDCWHTPRKDPVFVGGYSHTSLDHPTQSPNKLTMAGVTQ
jgi:hypothetical protein